LAAVRAAVECGAGVGVRFRLAPADHRCGPYDLVEGDWTRRVVWCEVCGRSWARDSDDPRRGFLVSAEEFGPWFTYGRGFVNVDTGEVASGQAIRAEKLRRGIHHPDPWEDEASGHWTSEGPRADTRGPSEGFVPEVSRESSHAT